MALYQNSTNIVARVIFAPDDETHGKTNQYTVREFSRPDGTTGKMLKARIGFESNPNSAVKPGEDRQMTFIDLVVWGGISNSPRIHEYFAKGAMLSLSNLRLVPNDWETTDGQKRYGFELHADQSSTIVPHVLLNQNNGSTAAPMSTTASTSASMESDAIPF